MLKELLGIVRPRNKLISVEVQGVHSITPPEAAIRETVESWLEGLELASKEDTNYQLEIGGWKRFGGCYGVRAFQVMDAPLNKIVELRVRVKEMNEFLWRCLLVCPSCEQAWEIMGWSNKESFLLIQVMQERQKELMAEEAPMPIYSRKERRYLAKKGSCDPSTDISKLMKGKVLRPLCHQIWRSYGDGPFPMDELFDKATGIASINGNSEIAMHFSQMLLFKGIIKPHFGNGDSLIMVGTEAMQERALDYEEELRQAEIGRLSSRKHLLAKQQTAGLQEIKKLRAKILQQKDNIKKVEKEAEELGIRIEQLEKESTGDFENKD